MDRKQFKMYTISSYFVRSLYHIYKQWLFLFQHLLIHRWFFLNPVQF